MASQVVAILGGKGMLGVDLAHVCADVGCTIQSYDLPECDITNDAQLRRIVESADVIVNAAAYTDVDGAETNADLARKVNGEAVGRLGELAAQSDKWVLHFSTDFVFDGQLDRPYVETDQPNPINEYGRSKYAGEQLLAKSGCRHCVARLEWTYGTHGPNFVTKLIDGARAGKPLAVVDDQIGSPTPTLEVAKVTCELLTSQTEGLFHLASSGYVSRFGMAQFIFAQLGMEVDLEPCPSSRYPAPASRPANSRFDCSKIQTLLNHSIEPWQDGLERFLRQL